MSKILPITDGGDRGDKSPVNPEKLIAGTPSQITDNQFTNAKENFFVGVWSSEAGKWRVTYSEDEMCTILEGTAIVTDADGVASTFGVGESFVIPAGFDGTWESVGNVKKLYVIYED